MMHSYFELLGKVEEEHGDKTAFAWFDENRQEVVRKSFREVASDVRRFIGCLKADNPDCEGEHIGIFARNSYHYVVCAMGILFAGAVVVPLNVRERKETIREEIEYADITRMYAEEAFLERMREDCDPAGIPVREISEYQKFDGFADADAGTDFKKAAFLIFTSGTTGKNKCVELSKESFFAGKEYIKINLDDLHEAHEAWDKNKFLMFLPMYHVMALTDTLSFYACGMEQDLCISLQYLYRDIKQFDPDYVIAVPALAEEWSKRISQGDESCLGTITGVEYGGAALDPKLVKPFEDKGIMVVLAYGMSETNVAGAYNFVNLSKKYSSVGKIPPSVLQAKFEDGELCLKGASIMTGYYKDPEETAKVLVDGWLHTGDLGYMDEDGYLFLTGRKKNLIILSSGENVSPEELEALVMKNTDVKEILVKEKEGKICAEIFCDADKQGSVRAYVTEVNRTLPMYKRMTRVEFRDEPFPKTATGKIQRV